MIVFSSALVLTRASAEVSDLPMIGWQNFVTIENLAADQEDEDFPASNLANPLTSSVWKSASTADQYLTITLSGADETDYLGVARHNFGTADLVASVEGILDEPGAVWEEIVGEQTFPDDSPVMFVFEADHYVGLRLKLQPDAVEPQAAVIYAGLSLTVPRSVQPGFQPIKYARDRDRLNGEAMNGDYTGTIIRSQRLGTGVEFRLLDPDFYWDEMQPFVEESYEPFFFALFPDTRPLDVAYCWATNDPKPVVSQYTEEVDIAFQLSGLGL
jgi:hypothetical protein